MKKVPSTRPIDYPIRSAFVTNHIHIPLRRPEFIQNLKRMKMLFIGPLEQEILVVDQQKNGTVYPPIEVMLSFPV
jgi:hypothetical protein